MAEVITEECSALAFYGIKADLSLIGGFLDTIDTWFVEHGRSLTHLAARGPGFSGKTGPADATIRRLRGADLTQLSSLTLISALPDAIIPMNDYAMFADCLKPYSQLSVAARSGIEPFGSHSFRSLAARLVDVARPAYGIGFRRGHRLGPASYAAGLVQGLEPIGWQDIEALNISFWNDARRERVWEQGIIRDVYPWNFLSASQLARSVGPLTLEDWIAQDSERGHLTPLSQGITLWELDHGALTPIRRELWREDVIFNWAKHVEGAHAHPAASKAALHFAEVTGQDR